MMHEGNFGCSISKQQKDVIERKVNVNGLHLYGAFIAGQSLHDASNSPIHTHTQSCSWRLWHVVKGINHKPCN